MHGNNHSVAGNDHFIFYQSKEFFQERCQQVDFPENNPIKLKMYDDGCVEENQHDEKLNETFVTVIVPKFHNQLLPAFFVRQCFRCKL